MQRLKALIPTGQFTRGVSVLAGGTALGQLIVALASPILTRLYTPDDFGVLAVFISIFSLLLTFNSLRYELAITLPENDEDAANITALVFLLVIVTTLIFGVLFWLFGDQLAIWLNMPALKSYYWLLLFSLLGAGFYQALNYWAIRKKTYTIIARTKLAQGIMQVGIQLLFGLMNMGTAGLLGGYTFGQIGGSTTLARQLWRDDSLIFRRVNAKYIGEMARRYRKFPLYMSWGSLVNAASLQLPALVLGVLYGANVAGWFALGQRMIALPMTLIGTSVGQVYFGAASQLWHDNPEGLNRLFTKTAGNLFLIGGIPLLLVGISGPWLFEFVMGGEWRTSGEFVQLLVPMFLSQFVVSTLSQTILVLERPDIQSYWDIIRLLVVMSLFLAAFILGFTPQTTIGLYSLSMCMMYIILFLLNKMLLKRIRDKHDV